MLLEKNLVLSAVRMVMITRVITSLVTQTDMVIVLLVNIMSKERAGDQPQML